MIVINFFGGPNSGKSTQAAGMFHRFKIDGYNAEHVNEYAKMCVWENRIDLLEDQLYVMAKQHRRVKRLADKVDFCITDSPVMLSSIYRDAYGEPHYSNTLDKIAFECFSQNDNINFMCKRDKQGWDGSSRAQDYQDALRIDDKMYKMFKDYKIPFYHLDINKDTIETAYNYIKKRLEKNNF
jgi:hypothetical protein